MPKINLSHFEYCVFFSMLSSIVLGVVSKRTNRTRLEYAIYCFGYFMIAVFVLGWLMYLGHG